MSNRTASQAATTAPVDDGAQPQGSRKVKYDNETTNKLIERYKAGASIPELALEFDAPERSIIAKLSSLSLYKRKEYVDKQGNAPIKKEVYIDRIAKLLDTNIELLESLEKVNKSVLKLLEDALSITNRV